MDDDGTAPINIGFNFTFGAATAYAQVRILSNGRLQFGNNCGYGTQSVGGGPPNYIPPPDLPLQLSRWKHEQHDARSYGADIRPAGGGGL